MSRSGYSEDGDSDNPIMYLWQSIVDRAIGGKRGQKLLKDLADALDAMPLKRLVAGSFLRGAGEVCVLGALGIARGLDLSPLERAAELNLDDEYTDVAGPAGEAFGVARSMAAEIMWQNDGSSYSPFGKDETPEERWARMRAWVEKRITP